MRRLGFPGRGATNNAIVMWLLASRFLGKINFFQLFSLFLVLFLGFSQKLGNISAENNKKKRKNKNEKRHEERNNNKDNHV